MTDFSALLGYLLVHAIMGVGLLVVLVGFFEPALDAYFKAKERFVDRMLEKGRRSFDGEDQ